jgi:hypothetical protein
VSLVNAIGKAGVIPNQSEARAVKKAYAERLSRALAEELAASLRQVGFPNVKPLRGQPGEKEFYGGWAARKSMLATQTSAMALSSLSP